MKKKPPPGATLIARLKERRMQREQEVQAEDISEQVEESVLDIEASESEESERASDAVKISIPEAKAQAQTADLFHRSISIEDLRPTTEDYEALTDEIRLAGRFAAVGLIAQGLRLSTIHHAEIHKEHYTSFEDYCRSEHQMSATYAYRLIRMAEMAEKVAERSLALGVRSQPDPFEIMLSLGHRHLMALLPLPQDKAEEFLVNGIPLISADAGANDRVSLDKASEKQIKLALKSVEGKKIDLEVSQSTEALSRRLSKLVKTIEECTKSIEDSPANFEMAKMEQAAELKDLIKKFDSAYKTLSRLFEDISEET